VLDDPWVSSRNEQKHRAVDWSEMGHQAVLFHTTSHPKAMRGEDLNF